MKDGEEVRVTDEATGGQKGSKLAQLGALDPETLLTLAKVAGFGAEKYEAHNFLRGYNWDLSFNAMQRHALTFWAGEDLDPESGLPHIAHAAWNALTLLAFLQRDIGTDTRPPSNQRAVVASFIGLDGPKLAAEVQTAADRIVTEVELKRGDRVRVLVNKPEGSYTDNDDIKAGDIGTVKRATDPDPDTNEIYVEFSHYLVPGVKRRWIDRDALAWVAV